MGKHSLSRRRVDRRISRKDVATYSMNDENYLDSNSDSGLDVGGPDSESRDDLSPEPIFKNPSIISYENAMDKLLLPILRTHPSPCNSSEPALKKPRMSRTHRNSNSVSGFCDMPAPGTNYADLLLEEANLECPEREVQRLPELQTVLKNILRTEACNGTQDLTAGQTKLDTASKTPPQSLQSSDGTNGNSRGGSSLSGALSGSGRRLPLGRRQLTLCMNFPSKSKNGLVELRILSQPEEQHRARYLTEGSRGAVKDRVGSGYPTIKLFGYCKPVTLQVFIGTDQGKVQPHLFYQASKVCGKNSAPCTQKKIDGTVVLELSLLPEKDMTLSCDCIGILKERNVDVEQRLLHFGGTRSKKRSTRCRLVFRALITDEDGSVEILQTASAPIVCTQPPGIPEICRKSLSESPAVGNMELFVIGKNFLKDTEVVFEECSRDSCDDHSMSSTDLWRKIVLPEKDFLQPNHLICTVPPYHDTKIRHPVRVRLLVQSSGKRSEPQNFTYLPVTHVGCPLPGLAPLASCVTDTALGLVQQPAQKPADILPALIQLPLAQAPAQEQQAKGNILSPHEINSHLKQEDSRGPQQMVITTLVIPSSTEGALTQAGTTHILQDNQHTMPAVSNTACSSSSGTENPLKTSHIQVLVMPPSTTMSVTASPQGVTSSASIQDSIINSFKNKISSTVMNVCHSEGSQFELQKQTSFRQVTSHEGDMTSRTFPQPGFPLSITNTSFSTMPKDVQTIQDLLLHDSAKSAMFGGSTCNDLSARMVEAECGNQSLQNSLRSGLGSSLENIPVQSLIQTSTSNDLEGQNIQQPSFLIGSDGTTSFPSGNQKTACYTNLIEKPTLNDVFKMERGIVKHEPKETDIPVTTSGFAVSVNSLILNPEMANSLTASNLVEDARSNHGTLTNPPSFSSYFNKERNAMVLQQHNSSASQPAHLNRQYEQVSLLNPVLANALAGVNISESARNDSQTSNVGRMSSSENRFQMPTIGAFGLSIGKRIPSPESHIVCATDPFPSSIISSNSQDSVAVANATSLLNFQGKLHDKLQTTAFSKILGTSHPSDITPSKVNFDPALLTKEKSNSGMVSASLVDSERFKSPNKLSFSKDHVGLGIQDLSNLSQDSSAVNFQNLNSSSNINPPFVENRSAVLEFQSLQNQMNVANSLDGSNFQVPISSSSSIETLQSSILTSVSALSSANHSINILSDFSKSLNMPNKCSNQETLPRCDMSAADSQSESVTFKTPSSQNIGMPDLGPLEDTFGNQPGKPITCSQDRNSPFGHTPQNVSPEPEQPVKGTLSNFSTDAQSLGLSVEQSTAHYIQQNLDAVSRVHSEIMSFTSSNSTVRDNRLETNMTAQNLGSIPHSLEGVSFTVPSQNHPVTSETAQKSFICENISINKLQEEISSFTATTSKPNETTVQSTITNHNLESSGPIPNFSIKTEASLQEGFSERNLMLQNSVQEGMTSFTAETHHTGKTMGPVSRTQELVPFRSSGKNVSGDSTQGSSFEQQNLKKVNNSQESSSDIASKGLSSSVNTSVPTGGSSMDQMSTMMSLLPESELLKIINPSTFDKM